MTTRWRPGRRLTEAAVTVTLAAAVAAALLAWPGEVGNVTYAPPARPMVASPPTVAAMAAARLALELSNTLVPSCNPTASLRPNGPPVVTPGSTMAKIRARGYLSAGVDQSAYNFGYLDPLSGQIEGFDIDMLHAISAAIFGNPDKIRFVAISDAQRIQALQSGQVDIVAYTMTINCLRLQQVDFSTVYFDALQRVLVLKNSPAVGLVPGLVELYGQKICATSGSTSVGVIQTVFGRGAVTVPYWTDCLVQLQEGKVAGISTDNSILVGLQAQDPYTKMIGRALANEPYGLAIAKDHPDFVRFVNAVLARMRADGQWAAIYRRWVGTPVPAPPPAHYLP